MLRVSVHSVFVCLCISLCPALSPQSDHTECLPLSRRRRKKQGSAHKNGGVAKVRLAFLSERILSGNLSLLFLSNMTEENDLGQAGKDVLSKKVRSTKNV